MREMTCHWEPQSKQSPGLLISKLPHTTTVPLQQLGAESLTSPLLGRPLIPATSPPGPSPHPFLTLLSSLPLWCGYGEKEAEDDPTEEKGDLFAQESSHILAVGLTRADPIPEGLWEIPGPQWVLLAH